jgi:phage recombination protein Bet
MNAVTAFDLSPRQIKLVHETVAKDCNAEEFDLYMAAAKSYGLDPFRKQIIPLVFGKNARDQSKRRMSIVVSRDGLRVIAQRCKNYRPASEPAEIITDDELKGPTNPKGIVMARVYLWQQDSRGDWFKVVGEAYWDEFAPLSYPDDAWESYDTGDVWEDSGKPKKARRLKPNAKQVLDTSGNWARMPIVMITKCAEAQALRAGWPDQFGSLYAEEEMDRARVIDLSASEIVAAEAEEQRMKLIGAADGIPMTWGDGWALEFVPAGQFADRAMEYIKQNDPATLRRWKDANSIGLKQFWAKSPSDALAVKKLLEAKIEKVAA